MNEQNDEAQSYALMVLAGLLALVIGGVLALAISSTQRAKPAAKVAAPTSATAAAMASADAAAPEARIYFETGSDALSNEAQVALASAADAARADGSKSLLISGFHDASGDATQNAELAKKRAMAVRHALEANGVTPDRLVLDKPALTTGAADAREARRVDVRLR
jgi:outer membrane protein OmpA-like peptidoglycan-associated protein